MTPPSAVRSAMVCMVLGARGDLNASGAFNAF